MLVFNKYINSLLVITILVSACLFTSCINDDFSTIEKTPADETREKFYIEGFSIGFTISLAKESGTRAKEGLHNTYDESFEDYIDTERKFKVLFFDEYGNFLFTANDHYITPQNIIGTTVSNWYVRVPVNYIADNIGNQFDVEAIKTKLKTENFKIAILANWPVDTEEPQWGWGNSILNTTAENVKNINDLHHLEHDGNYASSSVAGRPSNLDTYDFIMEKVTTNGNTKYLMGVKTDWVTELNSNKDCIMPSQTNPIPMYGVQNFNAIGEFWKEGSTFDVSSSSSDFNPITLIRSLAKVELYVPTSLGPLSHAFIRNINRTARCEPMDVESPTNTLWKDHTSPTRRYHCEWFDIQAYGPAFIDYNGEDYLGYQQLDTYTNWLSWFYGSWSKANWPDGDDTGWNFSKHNTNGGDISIPCDKPWPRLFNPDINACDFVNLNYVGIENDYYKYVIYVPDKNISDSIYPGVMSCTPKVPQIGYRLQSDDLYPDFKPGDNDCHRIYFTDYSNEEIKNILINTDPLRFEGEGSFERTLSNLKYLWPIMRNHVYQFFISREGGLSNAMVEVKIKDWGYGAPSIVEW